LPIGHLARQLADQRQGILGYGPTVLADRILFELQRSVVAALPMQDHLDMIAFDAHDDLGIIAESSRKSTLSRLEDLGPRIS